MASNDTEFADMLHEHVRAGYQCLWVPRDEEARLESEIVATSRRLDKTRVVCWDCAEGFTIPELEGDASRAEAKQQPFDPKFRMPIEALREIQKENGIFSGDWLLVFRDLDDYLRDPLVRRTIRTLCSTNRLVNRRFRRPLIITTTSRDIPDKIKDCVTILDFIRPSAEKLRAVFQFVKTSISDEDKRACSEELEDDIIQCLLGLTSVEAENALARCLVRHGGFTAEMLATIKDEKAAITKKSEVLTYIPEEEQATRDEIGGFENLMEFIDRRKLAYGKGAREVGLDYPKGVVLLGVPGTGKSYVAAAVANQLGLPGYIMDVGAVFGSLVGESEKRMRSALAQIDAQKGCVLLLDEADKAFGGATDSMGDSGVTRRIFGQLLSWLSSKNDKTFVIMTLNRTKGIPPEFLRAGRFDKVFYTDLPHKAECEQITKIHLVKRGVSLDEMDLADEDWDAITSRMKGFVGSEIEEVVKEARYISFEERQVGTPNLAEFIEAAESITPLSVLDAEGFEAIRSFCKGRAMPVSRPPEKRGGGGRTRAVSV